MNKNGKTEKGDFRLPEMIKVYTLKSRGIDYKTIAATIDRQEGATQRIGFIMASAAEGDKEKTFSLYGVKRNQRAKRAAWEYFNGKEKPEEKTEEKPAEQPTVQEKNEEHYFVAVLEEMREQTRLLKALCKAWGVEE